MKSAQSFGSQASVIVQNKQVRRGRLACLLLLQLDHGNTARNITGQVDVHVPRWNLSPLARSDESEKRAITLHCDTKRHGAAQPVTQCVLVTQCNPVQEELKHWSKGSNSEIPECNAALQYWATAETGCEVTGDEDESRGGNGGISLSVGALEADQCRLLFLRIAPLWD